MINNTQDYLISKHYVQFFTVLNGEDYTEDHGYFCLNFHQTPFNNPTMATEFYVFFYIFVLSFFYPAHHSRILVYIYRCD